MSAPARAEWTIARLSEQLRAPPEHMANDATGVTLRRNVQEAQVQVQAEITEHGTVTRPTPLAGSGEFQIAAQRAATLWRFEPTRIGGCGVPASVTIFVQFKMQ